LCAAIAWWLLDVRPSWTRSIWVWLFALTALASVLGTRRSRSGAIRTRAQRAWQPLYLSLGLTIALFVVAGLSDWRENQPRARRYRGRSRSASLFMP
jgi:hypothetical protein